MNAVAQFCRRARRDVVDEPVGGGVEDRHLVFGSLRLILRLLEQLGELLAARQLVLRGLVEIARELRERREIAVLRELELELTGDGLHRLGLRRAADARYREPDVDRGTDALEKQLRRQVDLPVGNRDDVRRNVGREVAGLRLDDRQRGQRSAAHLVGELRRAFEEARVQVEDVARICLAARRTAQQQRHLAIRLRVFGEIVVDDEDVFALVHQLFGHRAAGERRQPAQRRGFRRAHGDDGRVGHRALLLEQLCERRDRRILLADGDVHAEDVAAALIDDRVDRDRRLAGRPVADDELALALADRDQRVDGADAGLQRLLDGLALHDGRRDVLDRAKARRRDVALAVERLAERVDHAAEQRFADRHRRDAAGAPNARAFLDVDVGAHDHDADVVLFEVERDALQPVLELHELRRANAAQPVDAREVRSDLDHRTDLVFLDSGLELLDLLLENSGDFVSVYHPSTSCRVSF